MTHHIRNVADWVQTLDEDQIALLERHAADAELPPTVMRLLCDSPVSPMLVSEEGGPPVASMPPVIKQALDLRKGSTADTG